MTGSNKQNRTGLDSSRLNPFYNVFSLCNVYINALVDTSLSTGLHDYSFVELQQSSFGKVGDQAYNVIPLSVYAPQWLDLPPTMEYPCAELIRIVPPPVWTLSQGLTVG